MKYGLVQAAPGVAASHPSRGAWIEIGEWHLLPSSRLSHPSRGAWIEISVLRPLSIPIASHPSRGAWIEIPRWARRPAVPPSRTPHGVRGLKFGLHNGDDLVFRSHPSRGAWIEILRRFHHPCHSSRRTPHGVRGLKLLFCQNNLPLHHCRTPHGVRGLKSVHRSAATAGQQVAPLTGCVD